MKLSLLSCFILVVFNPLTLFANDIVLPKVSGNIGVGRILFESVPIT